ncbi:helix-turn-helix domain-containing protein [Chromobacterium violaceum]|uniref:HTH cro/C1-type domain-containing protein n=1 Tax=Chromobacterium violaceum TaxID=536 RepID=A0A202BAU7_CHRVL|nr:helix-turn-helix transcriptional regulator [Chromobacterium violaceum]OVE48559.1 hypothetical protein CBW21_08310 [Chromobacterium violaceum]
METLGTRLKAEREALDWTQRTLARRAGCGATTIASIETGRSRGSTKITAIAKALNLNPAWLESGKGPRRPATSDDSIGVLAENLAKWSDEELAELFRLILANRKTR